MAVEKDSRVAELAVCNTFLAGKYEYRKKYSKNVKKA